MTAAAIVEIGIAEWPGPLVTSLAVLGASINEVFPGRNGADLFRLWQASRFDVVAALAG